MEERKAIEYCRYESKTGALFIAASSLGVTDLSLSCDEGSFIGRLKSNYGVIPKKDCKRFKRVFKELDIYFSGRPVRFTSPLDLYGTGFEKSVWTALSSIPWGSTKSYGWVAARIGRPEAPRAVGNACGRNPVPIVIPCHRVLKGNGELGGYTGGVGIKMTLLKIEGIDLPGERLLIDKGPPHGRR